MKLRHWMATERRLRILLASCLFPVQCRLCRNPGQPGIGLCAHCLRELPWLGRGCQRCSRPLPPESDSDICASCLQHPRWLNQCSAVFIYQPPIDNWIHALKFRQQLGNARLLGTLLARHMQDPVPEEPVTVLPVPLHRKRLAERGYNQSLEIAATLRRKGYLLDPACCRRNRPTAAQSDLPAAARKRNIVGAFETTRSVNGEKFLLIDDVMTTGTTLEELARTLKRAGAARVQARVIARTVKSVY